MYIRCFIAVLVTISISANEENHTISWNEDNWALGCFFRGNDLKEALTRVEDCPLQCSYTSGCTHFSWSDYNGGTCFMKENNVSKVDAFKSGDPSALCGVVNFQETSESTETLLGDSGHSTRYWDCCKPSCSWNGKASVSAPVKACAKNGVAYIDKNVQSGCTGGGAYVCNNNIPWAKDNNLAYGFAAAHIRGKSERDWCCACYQLTFTSGPVRGKRMVVQVTNTGSDLGENHFDLQIPGGGVGQYNGCKSQWGAPDQGWGDRYGGVHSERDCNQLPIQIRNGCIWRFQWFKNADNPTFNFIPVTCPRELTQRTGCVRN